MPNTWLEQPQLHNDSTVTRVTEWVCFTRQNTPHRVLNPSPHHHQPTVTTLASSHVYSCSLCRIGAHPPFQCPHSLYCRKKNHSHLNCWYPHAHCHFCSYCIVPDNHKYAKITEGPCPYEHLHTSEDTYEDGGTYNDTNWEAKDHSQ